MILYLKKVHELLKKFVRVQVIHILRTENSQADCDAPFPKGPVDHRQPVETCVSHIMRPIHE